MRAAAFFLILTLFSFHAIAQTPTTVMIRAKAKDAKFIGTSIGGAYITVRDVANGRLLAEGYTTGSTGNTSVIMSEPRQRGKQLSDGETAGFLASLDIEEPTKVSITAKAPATHAQAAVEVSTQIWVIPGKNIEGDGVVLDIPGFIVDVLAPQTHERLDATGNRTVTIRANVVMMCGCPVTEGGMWNAADYQVVAIISHDGEKTEEVTLSVTEKANTFEGSFTPAKGGAYQVTVFAYDPQTGNTGVDKENFLVSK